MNTPLEVLAARLEWEVHMVTLTVYFLQDAWEIPPSLAKGLPFCASLLFPTQRSPNRYTKFPVVFSTVRKKPKSVRLVFNLRHECTFQPLKWGGKRKLNRMLFSRHQVILPDGFDTNLSKMNLNWNASAHAEFFIVDKDHTDKIPSRVFIFIWIFFRIAYQFWLVLCIW